MTNPVTPQTATRASGDHCQNDPQSRVVTFDLGKEPPLPVNNDLPKLSASNQRFYNRLLNNAKLVILRQQPTAYGKITRAFALKMTAMFGRVYDLCSREASFDRDEDSDPYILKSINLKASIQIPNDLKDNTVAKQIADDFEKDKQDALKKLTSHHKNLATLHREIAEETRLETFNEGIYNIIHVRVQSYIQDDNTNEDLGISLDYKALTAITAMRVYKGLGDTYFNDYLGTTWQKMVDLFLPLTTVDETEKKKLKGISNIPEYHYLTTTDNSQTQSSQQVGLLDHEQTLIDTIHQDMIGKQNNVKWLKAVTINSEAPLEAKRKNALKSARIDAREKARELETTTAQVSAAISDDPDQNIELLNERMKETESAQQEQMQAMKRNMRKNSSGGLHPKAKPGKQKRHGASSKEDSKKPSRPSKNQKNDNGKGKRKNRKCPHYQGSGKGKGKGKNRAANNDDERAAKRQKHYSC